MSDSMFTAAQPLRVILLTQDDIFFLPSAINYLLSRLPENICMISAVMMPVSPFGKKEPFLAKAVRTYKVFGSRFFLHYAWKFLRAKLAGRSVIDVLDEWGVPRTHLAQSINAESSIRALRDQSPDVLLSIAANEIFKRPLIDLARFGVLNLHTALLPKYRGLMPTFWAMKNEENETGVSVFLVDEGIDSGPILVQERMVIGGRSQDELIRDTKLLGMEAVVRALCKLRDYDSTTIENVASEASYYRFPNHDDVLDFYERGKRFYR